MHFFQHDMGAEEARAAYVAITEGNIATGVEVDRFRDALQRQFGFGPLTFSNSGTSSLHLALAALGVGPGDEVVTTPFTGVWTVNPILMVGVLHVVVLALMGENELAETADPESRVGEARPCVVVGPEQHFGLDLATIAGAKGLRRGPGRHLLQILEMNGGGRVPARTLPVLENVAMTIDDHSTSS